MCITPPLHNGSSVYLLKSAESPQHPVFITTHASISIQTGGFESDSLYFFSFGRFPNSSPLHFGMDMPCCCQLPDRSGLSSLWIRRWCSSRFLSSIHSYLIHLKRKNTMLIRSIKVISDVSFRAVYAQWGNSRIGVVEKYTTSHRAS